MSSSKLKIDVLICILLTCFAIIVPKSSAQTKTDISNPTITLFSFDRADEAEWTVVNDGVMGGRSAGFVTVENGTLRFTGTLVTSGGGFTLVRARRQVDMTGYAGVELRVRGNGRRFEVELDDGSRRNGRSVSRRAAFATSAEWTLVRVPFTALRSTIFGQAVDAPPIDLAGIQSVALYMADGQDGAFRLEVDYIRYWSDQQCRLPITGGTESTSAVTFQSTPSGADIEINGKFAGTEVKNRRYD